MHITLVKKILSDGSPCRKCIEVEERLQASGYWERIDSVLHADERDPQSEGWRLANHHGVDKAPFFVVRHPDGQESVYTVFFKFLNQVLKTAA
jgi:hypothetical protein